MDKHFVYQIKFCHTGTEISQGGIESFSNQSDAEHYINNYSVPNIGDYWAIIKKPIIGDNNCELIKCEKIKS